MLGGTGRRREQVSPALVQLSVTAGGSDTGLAAALCH